MHFKVIHQEYGFHMYFIGQSSSVGREATQPLCWTSVCMAVCLQLPLLDMKVNEVAAFYLKEQKEMGISKLQTFFFCKNRFFTNVFAVEEQSHKWGNIHTECTLAQIF